MTTTIVRPASDKQVAFLIKLLAERDTTDIALADVDETLSSRDASAMIDALMAAPRVATAAQAQPGYYVSGKDVIVVVNNRAGTRTYAKRLSFTVTAAGRTKATWEYAPGIAATVADVEPLSVEHAASLGHHHGVCVICCRTLTDPVSVERGIGPVCADKLA